MAVITISRLKGSLGDEIAKAVAEKLRYNYVDKRKISDALAEQGFPQPDFEKFDGKKPTIWQSLSNQKSKFTYFLRAAVYDFASSGNVVILGRGGQALLNEIPGTLHVRIIAPLKSRMQRIMETEDCDEKKSERLILQSDRDSSGYIRSFFDIDWNNSKLYDLVLNTRNMSVNTATSLICSAITEPLLKQSPKEIEYNLEDMALEQKTKGILVGFPGVDLTNVDVSQGIVVLAGLASSNESIERCQKTVLAIKGVKEVRSNLNVVPHRTV